MKKLHFFLVVLILIGTVPARSQVGPKTMDPNNQKIKEIAVKVDDAGWSIWIKERNCRTTKSLQDTRMPLVLVTQMK